MKWHNTAKSTLLNQSKSDAKLINSQVIRITNFVSFHNPFPFGCVYSAVSISHSIFQTNIGTDNAFSALNHPFQITLSAIEKWKSAFGCLVSETLLLLFVQSQGTKPNDIENLCLFMSSLVFVFYIFRCIWLGRNERNWGFVAVLCRCSEICINIHAYIYLWRNSSFGTIAKCISMSQIIDWCDWCTANRIFEMNRHTNAQSIRLYCVRW